MLAALAVLLGGCSRTVTLTAPTPSAADRAGCATLIRSLPARVDGQSRRTVSAPDLTAAWGDPPISARCGVPRPAGLTAAAPCYEVDGVGWFAQPAAKGYLFTTIGRAFYVEVGVPHSYAPEADALTDLGAAVKGADPLRQACQ